MQGSNRMWYFADYQGWTNWDTWHTKLMMDNEQELYTAQQKMAEEGWTPEQIRDWALQHVVGPHNKQAIEDARSWNEIPEDERIDHHYEDLKNKSPEAADIVDGLGFGRDVSDTEPTLMDPELINWHEIHQHINDEHNENAEYEREHERLQGAGLSPDWITPGHDDAIQHMREAMYRYHGALPDEEMKADNGGGYTGNDPRSAHRRTVTIPYDEHIQSHHFSPEAHMSLDSRNALRDMLSQRQIDRLAQEHADDPRMRDPEYYTDPWHPQFSYSYPEYLWYKRTPASERDKLTQYDINDPEQQALLNADPSWQDFTQNGYKQRLTDYTWDAINDLHKGQATPRQTQEMQAALAQRGLPPEQIAGMMQQRRQWDGENWTELQPKPPAQPDPTLDQPGDFTLPPDWTARVGGLTRQSMPAVLYHSAPASVRQQIMQQGILPKQALQPEQPYYPGDEHVWTFNDPDTAAWWAKGDRGGDNDVWRINAQALPQSAIDYGAAKDYGTFLHGRVPPHALELHYPSENLPSTQPAWTVKSTWNFSPLSYTGEEKWPDLDTKTAGMTLPQQLRAWGPEPFGEPVHQFDDGWTVHSLTAPQQVQRVGEFMRNCWQAPGDPVNDPTDHYRQQWIASNNPHTLHDEHGLPRLAFMVNGPFNAITQPLRTRNMQLSPDEYQRLAEFGQAQGYHVHPFDHYHAMGWQDDDGEDLMGRNMMPPPTYPHQAKTAAAFHPKHHTTAADHERGKARYGLPKPHKRRKLVLFPKKRKGAVDPGWLQQWIDTNGPWLYHSCDASVRDKILKEGLVPHDRGPGSKYENVLVPRDNSVYIRAFPESPFQADFNPNRVAIDLRKLDPNRIQADEDAVADTETHTDIGIPRTTDRRGSGNSVFLQDAEGNQFPHWGAWADHWQLNQPGHTAHSLNAIKTASVFGGISPEALSAPELVPQHELSDQIQAVTPAPPLERVYGAPAYPERKVICPRCHGEGSVMQDDWGDQWIRACPECRGDGYLINNKTASMDDFMEGLDAIPGVRRITPVPNLIHSYEPGDRVTFEYNSPIDPHPDIPEAYHGMNANTGTIHRQLDDGRYLVRWDLGADWSKHQPYYAPGEVSYPIEGQSLWPEGHEALEHGLTDPQDPKSLELLYPPKESKMQWANQSNLGEVASPVEYAYEDEYGHVAAAQSPSVMYHNAPRDNRESIMQHGLDHTQGQSGTDYERVGTTPGNYLWADHGQAQRNRQETEEGSGRAFDTWVVQTNGLALQPDSYWADTPTQAHWVAQPISPERMRLGSIPSERGFTASDAFGLDATDYQPPSPNASAQSPSEHPIYELLGPDRYATAHNDQASLVTVSGETPSVSQSPKHKTPAYIRVSPRGKTLRVSQSPSLDDRRYTHSPQQDKECASDGNEDREAASLSISQGDQYQFPYSSDTWGCDGWDTHQVETSVNHTAYEGSDRCSWSEASSSAHTAQHTAGYSDTAEGPISEGMKGIPCLDRADRGALIRAQSTFDGTHHRARGISERVPFSGSRLGGTPHGSPSDGTWICPHCASDAFLHHRGYVQCRSCGMALGIPGDENLIAINTEDQLQPHPDPWMDNEPGATTFPEHWSAHLGMDLGDILRHKEENPRPACLNCNSRQGFYQGKCLNCGYQIAGDGAKSVNDLVNDPQAWELDDGGGWANLTDEQHGMLGPPRQGAKVHGSVSDGTDFYYHIAPTEERQRIQQWGLQPSDPAHSTNFRQGLPGEPRGVYVTRDPGNADATRGLYWKGDQPRPMDIWRIPGSSIQSLQPDPKHGWAMIVPHAVPAELHEPYEASLEKWGAAWQDCTPLSVPYWELQAALS